MTLSALISILALSLALASQQARVKTTDKAPVHQYPNRTSPQIGTLPAGQTISVSSKMVRSLGGVYWYKTRLPSGEAGYVEANRLDATELEIKAQKTSGVKLDN